MGGKWTQGEESGGEGTEAGFEDTPFRKRLRMRSVMSVNYHYITVLCPFNLLIRF